MELHTVDLIRAVFKRRNGAKRRRADGTEAVGQLCDHIGMAHKHGLICGKLIIKLGCGIHLCVKRAVLAGVAASHSSAE